MSPAARRAPAKSKLAPVVVAGPPRRLTVSLPAEVAPKIVDVTAPVEARLEGAKIESVIFSDTRRGEPDGLRVQVSLDPLTPPGRYEGSATIGKVTVPIVADVAARLAIRHDPAVIELDAAPEQSIDVPLTVHNTGNVPTDVPDESTFVLLDRSGFTDAFYHAIGEPPPEGKQRVDVLFDDLAASNGGAVTVTAKREGTWPLAPGASGAVTITLAFSGKLRPGAEYAGAWNIDATHVPVRIKVPAPPVEAPAPPKTTTKPRTTRRKETPSS